MIRILKRDLSGEFNVEIVEEDALVVLKERHFDILFSNLPFFLTEDILEILSTKVSKYRSASSHPTTTNHSREKGSELVISGNENKITHNRLFQKAIISVHNDDNYLITDVNNKYPHLIITTSSILDPDDFSPRQPFKSKVIVVLPRLSDSDR